MFYTKSAKFIAGLGILVGASILLIAILSMSSDYPAGQQLSGKTINNGFYCIIGAVVLGVLAEISQSLAVIAKSGN
ncbi:MAG: hypothetical protein E6Q50_08760 [Lysobacter sp.]|nr:MAG: hypothetical protein E6Q50_08760 [Lysobacter sp.]